MPDIIISDVHLGSPFCNYQAFSQFLAALPDNARLILNGDTLDNPHAKLPDKGEQALRDIADLSRRIRAVIWVEGNHDAPAPPPPLAHLETTKHITLQQKIYVTHGHCLDTVMPRHRWFIKLFHFLHNIRIALGAPPVHVAEYAKKWPRLFNVLRRNVLSNALASAREHGCSVVTCGHIHKCEEAETEGIRYLNTGSWTQSTFCYVLVQPDHVKLIRFTPGDSVPPKPDATP